MKNNIQKKILLSNHRRVKTDTENQFEAKNTKIQLRQNTTRINRRCNTQSKESRFEKQLQIHKNQQTLRTKLKNSLNLTYNKWYIKPSVRLKRSLICERKPNQLDVQFAYNRLYEQSSLRTDCPFLTTKNSKLQLLQKIPVHNLRLLQVFKRSQQLKKKRVPKIIDLFLKKKVDQEGE